MRYFKKLLPENLAILSSGKGFKFPVAASGVGLMAVDPVKRPDLIRDFEILISKQRAGIVEISQAEFEEEKKKSPPEKRAWGQEGFSVAQAAQMRRNADRVNAELADKEREERKRQLTPVISRGFKRPGMKFAGAVANPGPDQTQPGQWRPGVTER